MYTKPSPPLLASPWPTPVPVLYSVSVDPAGLRGAEAFATPTEPYVMTQLDVLPEWQYEEPPPPPELPFSPPSPP